jgi:hypothetical protein
MLWPLSLIELTLLLMLLVVCIEAFDLDPPRIW